MIQRPSASVSAQNQNAGQKSLYLVNAQYEEKRRSSPACTDSAQCIHAAAPTQMPAEPKATNQSDSAPTNSCIKVLNKL